MLSTMLASSTFLVVASTCASFGGPNTGFSAVPRFGAIASMFSALRCCRILMPRSSSLAKRPVTARRSSAFVNAGPRASEIAKFTMSRRTFQSSLSILPCERFSSGTASIVAASIAFAANSSVENTSSSDMMSIFSGVMMLRNAASAFCTRWSERAAMAESTSSGSFQVLMASAL